MIGDRLTWSQASAVASCFYLICTFAYFIATSRRARRRRGASLRYNCGRRDPHHSSRRNGTQAVP